MDVLVERWNRRTSLAGVRVHEATDLIDADRTIVDSIPCTSVVRTLLDVAAVDSRRVDPTRCSRTRCDVASPPSKR